MEYRLTGGIFFMLLLTARKHRIQKKRNWMGESDDLQDWQVMFGIDRIISPTCPEIMKTTMSTYESAVNRYKACSQKGSSYIKMVDKSVKDGFEERINGDYVSVLKDVEKFVDTFLLANTEEKKDYVLVRALMDLLDRDEKIKDDAEFHVGLNGETLKKEDLIKERNICFEPFLLGVLHYLVMNDENNKEGEDTYNECCPPASGGKREYDYRFGKGKYADLELSYSSLFVRDIDNVIPEEEESKTFTPENEQARPNPQTLNQRVINVSGNARYIENVENYYEKEDD